MSLLEAPVLDPAKIWVSKSLKHDRMLTRGQFSPCGKLVAAGGVDNQVHYWDLATDKKTTLVGHVGWVSGLAFHADSERLFTGDFHGMLLCWPITGKEEKPLWTVKEAHPGGVSCLIMSPDGKVLISGGYDRAIRVWSPQDGKLVKEFKEHEGHIFCTAFHPDGKSFVAGGLFPKIRHWDLESGKLIREIETGSLFVPAGEVQVDMGGVRAMALDAKGTLLACAGARGGASDPGPGGIVIDWESGKLKQQLKVKGEGGLDGHMTDISFLSDATLIGSASGSASGGFFFWKQGQEEPFHTLLGGGDSKRKMSGSVHQMSLHSDGLRVAATLHVAKGHAGNGGAALVKKGEYLCHAGGVGVFNLYAKPPDAVELKNAK